MSKEFQISISVMTVVAFAAIVSMVTLMSGPDTRIATGSHAAFAAQNAVGAASAHSAQVLLYGALDSTKRQAKFYSMRTKLTHTVQLDAAGKGMLQIEDGVYLIEQVRRTGRLRVDTDGDGTKDARIVPNQRFVLR